MYRTQPHKKNDSRCLSQGPRIDWIWKNVQARSYGEWMYGTSGHPKTYPKPKIFEGNIFFQVSLKPALEESLWLFLEVFVEC